MRKHSSIVKENETNTKKIREENKVGFPYSTHAYFSSFIHQVKKKKTREESNKKKARLASPTWFFNTP